MNARGRRSQEKNVTGQSHVRLYYEVKHVRTGDGNKPFPNKPVCHKKTPNPTSHDPLELDEFGKISISNKSSAPSYSQEYMSNTIRRKNTGSQQLNRDSFRQPIGELQMDKVIHTKKLMLQTKLWKVEELIRQRFQWDSVGAAADAEEQVNDYRGREETETSQRRESQGSRELIQDKKQEVKQQRKMQDPRKEDRMTKEHGEQEVKKDRTRIQVAENPQSEIKGTKGTHEDTFQEEEAEKETKQGKVNHKRQNITCTMEEKTACGPESEHQRALERKITEEAYLSQLLSPSHPSIAELEASEDRDLLLLPCRVCNRKFSYHRLEKHVQVCEQVKHSKRQVFNSYVSRTKGSAVEEYFKTHNRSTSSPEGIKKRYKKQKNRTQHQSRQPAGASKLKWSK